MMSYRHSIASTASADGACDVNNNNNLLAADNLLRLALKKPQGWKWELTTSSSSPNISFPKIQLFDGASGELMVEVDRPDCVIRSDCSDVGRGPVEQNSSSSSRELDSRQGRYRRSRTSLVKEKLSTSGDSLADIFNQLQSKGLGHKLSTSGSQYRLLNGEVDESHGSLQKSKSANAIGMPEVVPIVRRRSRRSLASRSSSILERISEFYGRSSTEEEEARSDLQLALPPVPQLVLEPASDEVPEGVTIEELPGEQSTSPIKPRPKIYKLVRSNIGTLMVREESFHTQRSLRRRQREMGELRVASPQELVELDEQTDRPRPVDVGEVERYRYEREINRIDGLLSRVMLSHDLQTEEVVRTPGIRISEPVEQVSQVNGCSPHQNGHSHRRRRSRRSVSVGGSVTSSRHRSVSSGRNGRHRSTSESSTSEGEQAPQRTGSSSRSGSQKRRGRTRHRDPASGPQATISNVAPSAAAPSCQTVCRQQQQQHHHRPHRRLSMDGGQPDTLALERFRASLQPYRGRALHDAASVIITNVPAIDASASAAVTLQQLNGSTSSSSGSTLSTLSPWTSSPERVAQVSSQPTTVTTINNNYPLGRSISVPCGGITRDSVECNFLERLRRSLEPISGDALRQRYMMEEKQQQQQQLQSGESKVPKREPPGRRNLLSMASVVEEALYKQRASASRAKPPTGKRTGSMSEGESSKGKSDAPQQQNKEREEMKEPEGRDPDEPPLSCELANTVEPPFRGRRTLKYYSRRYRTTINYDNSNP